MSQSAPGKDSDIFDLQEQVVRINRAIAETQKFQAEMNKLTEEALKFRRERWMLVIAAIGGLAGFIAAGITAAKTVGWIG